MKILFSYFLIAYIINNMLIAHRGYSSMFKDNTKEAFYYAIQIGYDMIELDVNICKTGELVICHDLTIRGKAICEFELHELQEESVMTLHEYFHSINRNIIPTYIDVKGNDDVMKKLMNYLECNRYVDLSKIYVGTFSTAQLNMIIERELPVRKGLITSNRLMPQELSKWVESCDFFSFNWESFDNDLFDYLQRKNKDVYLYTCRDVHEYEYIVNNYRYDGIISNVYIVKNI